MNPTMDAVYLLSPQSHIVDCLLADIERRRYKRCFLVWTSVLDPHLRRRIDGSPIAKQQIAGFETLSIDYFPRESHLVTFRDPWSFPILYHPSCNGLVKKHMEDLAQKVWEAVLGLCTNHVDIRPNPRLLVYVCRWENIPKCDITAQRIQHTKPVYYAPILPASSLMSWMNMLNGTPTSHRRVHGLRVY